MKVLLFSIRQYLHMIISKIETTTVSDYRLPIICCKRKNNTTEVAHILVLHQTVCLFTRDMTIIRLTWNATKMETFLLSKFTASNIALLQFHLFSSNPRPAKCYTELQTVRHCFNIYANSCVFWRYVAEMGTANSLHASA